MLLKFIALEQFQENIDLLELLSKCYFKMYDQVNAMKYASKIVKIDRNAVIGNSLIKSYIYTFCLNIALYQATFFKGKHLF